MQLNKRYKKSNGYYKFYNAEGVPCRIKFDSPPKNNQDILLKFKNKYETKWLLVVPNQKFSSESQVLNYILKNLQNTDMVFKVITKF